MNDLTELDSMSVLSADRLIDSIARMLVILITVCNSVCVKNEHEVKGSITLEAKNTLESEFRRFIEVAVYARAILGYGACYALAPVLLEVGESYKAIMGIAEPWRVVWENVYNTMMCECLPHPVYGFPVKINLEEPVRSSRRVR